MFLFHTISYYLYYMEQPIVIDVIEVGAMWDKNNSEINYKFTNCSTY